MDLIIGLSRTSRQHDNIMVVVDRLKKIAHFIPLKSTFSTNEIGASLHSRCSEVAWCSKDNFDRHGW